MSHNIERRVREVEDAIRFNKKLRIGIVFSRSGVNSTIKCLEEYRGVLAQAEEYLSGEPDDEE